MRARPPRRPHPPVRLISYRPSSVAVDRTAAPDAARPGAFPPRPGAPPPAPLAPPTGKPPLRAVPAGEESRDGDLMAAASVIARTCAEVIAGIRPLHHLAGRATPAVYERLAAAIPVTGPVTGPARAGACRAFRVAVPLVQEPSPGAAEVCAVVFAGARAQALALRLERCRGRWRCAAIETTISPRRLRDHLVQRPGTAA
jgi:hypothetical protein